MKEKRMSANMSQEDVARMTGISRQLISAWENGKRSPSRKTEEKLKGFLGKNLGASDSQSNIHDSNTVVSISCSAVGQPEEKAMDGPTKRWKFGRCFKHFLRVNKTTMKDLADVSGIDYKYLYKVAHDEAMILPGSEEESKLIDLLDPDFKKALLKAQKTAGLRQAVKVQVKQPGKKPAVQPDSENATVSKEEKKELVRRMREKRIAEELSAGQLADIIGVKSYDVYNWENEKTCHLPADDKINHIRKYLAEKSNVIPYSTAKAAAKTERQELVRRMREKRIAEGLSARQLADILKVDTQNIYYWESDKCNTLPKGEVLDRIRGYLAAQAKITPHTEEKAADQAERQELVHKMREKRIAEGLSPKQLAEVLGVKTQAVYRWESDTTNALPTAGSGDLDRVKAYLAASGDNAAVQHNAPVQKTTVRHETKPETGPETGITGSEHKDETKITGTATEPEDDSLKARILRSLARAEKEEGEKMPEQKTEKTPVPEPEERPAHPSGIALKDEIMANASKMGKQRTSLKEDRTGQKAWKLACLLYEDIEQMCGLFTEFFGHSDWRCENVFSLDYSVARALRARHEKVSVAPKYGDNVFVNGEDGLVIESDPETKTARIALRSGIRDAAYEDIEIRNNRFHTEEEEPVRNWNNPYTQEEENMWPMAHMLLGMMKCGRGRDFASEELDRELETGDIFTLPFEQAYQLYRKWSDMLAFTRNEIVAYGDRMEKGIVADVKDTDTVTVLTSAGLIRMQRTIVHKTGKKLNFRTL